MPEVVVNGRFLTRRVTGVERYGGEILRYIGDRCRIERPRRILNGWMGHAWEQAVLAARIKPGSMLWSPANTGPLLVHAQVLTIHDLSALEHPEWFHPSFAAWYRLLLPILARRVRRIIVPSEYIRQKVLKRFSPPSGKVVTIRPGVDASKYHPMHVSNDMGQYALFVGTLEPRKNLIGLLHAWEEVKNYHPDVSLAIAGATGPAFKELNYPASAERVCWLGYVPEAELPRLYAGAEVFVLPSLDEGFGLTALEAMACGTPVIVSNGGALPELVGEAGLVFELSDPSGLSKALNTCLSESAVRTSLVEKGLTRARAFSWEQAARTVWETLNEA